MPPGPCETLPCLLRAILGHLSRTLLGPLLPSVEGSQCQPRHTSRAPSPGPVRRGTANTARPGTDHLQSPWLRVRPNWVRRRRCPPNKRFEVSKGSERRMNRNRDSSLDRAGDGAAAEGDGICWIATPADGGVPRFLLRTKFGPEEITHAGTPATTTGDGCAGTTARR
jgi:hypothetical protein